MRNIAQAIDASLFERARFFVKRRQAVALAAELGLSPLTSVELCTLETLATILAHVARPIPTLIDVGAHLGAFAEPASQVLKAVEVVCVEPHTAHHPAIRARLSRIRHHILGCALSDRPGVGTLHVHADTSMSSLLDVDRSALGREFATYDQDAIDSSTVPVSTLDCELSKLGLDPPFFLKVDTQGTELRILEGATKSLQQTTAVLVEHMFTTPYIHASSFHALVSFMHRHGFTCAAPTSLTRRATHRVSAVDLLFVANPIPETWPAR